jgi:NADPH-dependent 2,4-dienoyl-CoA reductase/sulfur reductase-like enzyme/nitrite reductase/ring-hydroxylating ferredoxin subunit
MSEEKAELKGPDLEQGIALDDLPDGAPFIAHAFGKPFVVVRRASAVNAIGATCSHYSGPLAEGLVVGDTIRCPWHHACFSLRTGEALRAPALKPVPVCAIEQRGRRVFAVKEIDADDGATAALDRTPIVDPIKSIVIVGGGAAGNAAAEMLRRDGFAGSVTMITADDSLPYDRPNLSKDYLAGNAPEDWLPLRSAGFYAQHDISVIIGMRATALDTASRRLRLEDGREMVFDRLLIATGANPVRLDLPGGDLPHVHYLRTLNDSHAIASATASARRAVVIGASFIGLEVAASLRARGLTVHVVAPETLPLARIMGPELGAFVRDVHERHGVVFHLGQTPASIDASGVVLKSDERIDADLVVIGVGVKPELALAESAGLRLDRGVLVNEFLESSAPGIYAAGDIARWPDAASGAPIRVEHWVVAERQGQTAAKNMLGRREPFRAVPFFWSAHYDTTISYVGHAERWDEISVGGDLSAGSATVTMKAGGATAAVITVGRDLQSLQAEHALEQSRA